MALYSGNLLDERNQRPIEGAELWVYDNFTGNEATLTDIDNQPITQPLTTGPDGEFVYQATDGLYRHDFWKNSTKIYTDQSVAVGPRPAVSVSAIESRPAFPSLQDYDNQGDTTASTQIARYLAQDAGSGLPLLLNGPIVLGESIDMVPGAKLIAPGGPLNVVTKFLATPTAPGLLPVTLESGFTGNVINVPADCYDAYLEGLWLDCRNQVSGDGVSFNESLVGGGTAAIILRSGSVMRRCKVYSAAGRGIYGASLHHEINLFNVLIQNTRGLAGSYLEGGDYTIDQLWSQEAAEYGHYFKNAAECRIGHIEAWASGKDNFRISGFTRGLTINRLISDIAGEHGVNFIKEVGDTHMPDLVRIMNARSSTSGSKVGGSNTYDDFHFNDGDGLPSGTSRIHIGGLAGGSSGQPTRHNIGGTIAASTNFRSLYDWRISSFNFNQNSTVAGTRAAIMNDAARKVIQIGSGVKLFNGSVPEPLPQTPLTGGANLVENGDFSAWSGTVSQPDGWLASASATLALDAVNTFEGRSSLKITAGASLNGGAIYHVPNPLRYRGKRMTLAVRIINSEAEATGFNTRIRVAAGSVTIPDYLVGISAGIQYIPLSFDVGSDATFISVLVTPCGVSTDSGRSVSIQDVVLVEGNQIHDVVPRNPGDVLGWHSVSLTPTGSPAQVALDARFGGGRYKLSFTTAGRLIGIANAKPMQEVLIEFTDNNVELWFYSTLRRTDGLTTPIRVKSGTIMRAVWNGNFWMCTIPNTFNATVSTIANLPSADYQDQSIWNVSDTGGDSAPVYYRGGKYRRFVDGAPEDIASTTDAAVDYLANSNVIRLTGVLAAGRTLTLTTTKAAAGATWEISRTGGGAFDWTIATTAITIAANQSVTVRWTGSALVLTGRGTV